MSKKQQTTKYKSLDELRDELEQVLALLADQRVGKIGAHMPNPNLEVSHESFRRLDGLR